MPPTYPPGTGRTLRAASSERFQPALRAGFAHRGSPRVGNRFHPASSAPRRPGESQRARPETSGPARWLSPRREQLPARPPARSPDNPPGRARRRGPVARPIRRWPRCAGRSPRSRARRCPGRAADVRRPARRGRSAPPARGHGRDDPAKTPAGRPQARCRLTRSPGWAWLARESPSSRENSAFSGLSGKRARKSSSAAVNLAVSRARSEQSTASNAAASACGPSCNRPATAAKLAAAFARSCSARLIRASSTSSSVRHSTGEVTRAVAGVVGRLGAPPGSAPTRRARLATCGRAWSSRVRASAGRPSRSRNAARSSKARACRGWSGNSPMSCSKYCSA